MNNKEPEISIHVSNAPNYEHDLWDVWTYIDDTILDLLDHAPQMKRSLSYLARAQMSIERYMKKEGNEETRKSLDSHR